MTSLQNTVTSKDGTTIAFERSGTGAAIVLVSPALGDRSGNTNLARALNRNLSAINYDRRGRGASSDTPSYAVQREIEDIEALIDRAGGSAFLFGSSSGAVLALEAANRLGNKVKALMMYEPPFIVDSSRPPVPADYVSQLRELLAAGRRGEAVTYFMREAVGVPDEILERMRSDSMWPALEAVAHTLPYDGAVMGDTMSGRPLAPHRWDSVAGPVLVMAGGASPAWLQSAAQAVVAVLPRAKYREVEGRDHSAMMTGAVDIATTLYGFFLVEHL